jgi:hypothetical protein
MRIAFATKHAARAGRQVGGERPSAIWLASRPLLAAAPILLAGLVGMALAAEATVGNPATKRASVDTYTNFTLVDTNNSVSATGFLNTFQYYADNKAPFEFILVDQDDVVQWMSPTIMPKATGVQTYISPNPVSVQAGWNLGFHVDAKAVIPFDTDGANIVSTANNSGKPKVSEKLTVFKIPSGTFSRTYSMNATQAR